MEKQTKKNSASQWGRWNWYCNVSLRALFACVLALAVLWSTGRLVEYLFPSLEIFRWVFACGGGLAAGSSVWNTVCGELLQKKRLRHIGNLAIFGIVGAVLLRVAYLQADQLEQGFWYVELLIKAFISHYKGMDIAVSDGGLVISDSATVELCGSVFLSLIAAAVFLILQTIAAERKRSIWLAALPAAVVIFGLCVGKAPDFAGLAGTFLCLILLASVSWNKKKNIGMSSLLTGILAGTLALAMVTCSTAADWFAAKEQQMLPVQKKLERQIAGLFSGASNVQDGIISNKYPEYTGEEMLQVRTKVALHNTLYLRGTYADTYKDGHWTREKEFALTADRFSGYEDCQDLDPAVAVANESAQKYQDLLGISVASYALPEMHYDIRYTGLHNETLYLPYGPEIDTMTEGYTLEGDYQFRKQKKDTHMDVVALGGTAEMFWLGTGVSDLYYNDEQTFSKYDAFYEAYSDYVEETYLDVPEDMVALKQIAQELRSESQYDGIFRALDDPVQKNSARLQLCDAVSSALQMSYSYQKQIPDAGDMDPVEFFLKEKNGGFCVHFASAGVLLLRELGVPARYVSGYRVENDEFTKTESQEEEYRYECSVPDSDAHAWAEVYLDDYGWLPVEMTPSEEDSAERDKIRGTYTDPEQDQAAMDPADENSSAQETQSAEQPTQDPSDVSDAQTDQTSTGKNGGSDGSGFYVSQNRSINWKMMARVFVPAAAAVAVLLLVLQEKKRRETRWQKEFARARNNGCYSRAARMLNLRFYRRLVKEKKLSGRQMKDREYAENLQKLYPEQDWNRYLQIIQKAVYADTELTEEEYLALERTIRSCMPERKK